MKKMCYLFLKICILHIPFENKYRDFLSHWVLDAFAVM